MYRRYAFACAYLACYLVTEAVYVLLNPHAQTALTAWASTNVANLEHEPPARSCCRRSSGRETCSSGRC